MEKREPCDAMHAEKTSLRRQITDEALDLGAYLYHAGLDYFGDVWRNVIRTPQSASGFLSNKRERRVVGAIGLAMLLSAGVAAYKNHVDELPQLTSTTQPSQNKYKTTDFSEDDDATIAARVAFGEARGCDPLERAIIIRTLVNRARDGKRWNGETIKEVALMPSQYSCFNKGDSNRKKVMDPEEYGAEMFYECLRIARAVLKPNVIDTMSQGATNYFNPDVVKKPKGWKWERLEEIGHIDLGDGKKTKHKFYRED